MWQGWFCGDCDQWKMTVPPAARTLCSFPEYFSLIMCLIMWLFSSCIFPARLWAPWEQKLPNLFITLLLHQGQWQADGRCWLSRWMARWMMPSCGVKGTSTNNIVTLGPARHPDICCELPEALALPSWMCTCDLKTQSVAWSEHR